MPGDLYSALSNQPFRFALGYVNPIPQSEAVCPFHSHANMEIVYHAKGRGVTRIRGGQEFAFEQGSVNVYPPLTEHDQQTAAPGQDICIHVLPFRELPVELEGPLYIPPPLPGSLTELIYELSRAGPFSSKAQIRYYDSLCCSLLAGLVVARSDHHRRMRAPAPHAQHYAQKAYDLIRQNYRSLNALDEIAAESGIGYSRLRSVFRQRYGKSLKQWLMEVRVHRAKELLSQSRLPLKAIADQCGYGTDRYFCTCFKRWVGLTPSEYRVRFQRPD